MARQSGALYRLQAACAAAAAAEIANGAMYDRLLLRDAAPWHYRGAAQSAGSIKEIPFTGFSAMRTGVLGVATVRGMAWHRQGGRS